MQLRSKIACRCYLWESLRLLNHSLHCCLGLAYRRVAGHAPEPDLAQSQEMKVQQSVRMETAELAAETELEHAQAQAQEMSKFERRRFSNACLDEEAEQARAMTCVRLLQESILSPLDDEEEHAGSHSRRPPSPYHYALAIDHTAAKMVAAATDRCKHFQGVSALFRDESQELLATLVGLGQILQSVVGSPWFARFHETLEDVLLCTTKLFAFLEELGFKTFPHESTHGAHKAACKMNEFACRLFNLTVRLCHEYSNCGADDANCATPRCERLSFGVTTYAVPVHDLAHTLLKKKRAHIAFTDLDNTSEYSVVLSYPHSLFSKSVAMSARVETPDRGFSQTLHADRVNIAKGTWGWEEARDTVLITFDDVVVANVASVSGSLLTYNRHSRPGSTREFRAQKYRTSVQIVGSSRIDLDLQNLLVKGVKERELVYYKCFVNTQGREEVLGIYRFVPWGGEKAQGNAKAAEGELHIVGRGNQPGLRHVLVSIFVSLGFTAAA